MFIPSTCQLDRRPPSRYALRPAKIFRSIVFPVDFSGTCNATAPYVRDLAEFTGGTVTLLHVVPERSAWYGAADVHSGFDDYEVLRTLKKIQMSALATFRDEYFNGVECQIRIESGSVADRIIDYTERSGADLIMMPRCGTFNSAGSFVGPVLEKVLHDAACPVWTSPQSDKFKPFTGFHSIVCTISPKTIPSEYVTETMALGASFGGRVSFVSAVAIAGSFAEDPRALSFEVARSGCPVYVEVGLVGDVVRHVAEIQSADLVVINRSRKPHSIGGYKSHTNEIVFESPCPVLCLPGKMTAASVDIIQERHLQERYFLATAAC
jgi:nucleotide-binding universal stress UspA family protein